MDKQKVIMSFFIIIITIALLIIPVPESESNRVLLGLSLATMLLVLPQIGILWFKINEKKGDN